MQRTKLILAFLAIAVASFMLGHGWRPNERARGATGLPDKPVATTNSATEVPVGTALSKEPPQTYRGPDGRPHLIVYNQEKPRDDRDPAQIQAAMLADMRNHPAKVAGDYGMELEQVQRIAAGKEDFPKLLLPPNP